MTIGEKIKTAREAKGLTQTELAKLFGYKSRSSINKIENNERDIPRSSIIKFAEILGVSPSYLMGWEEPHYGQRIKEVREFKGMTQEELASRAEIELQALQCYEKNENQPNNEILFKIVDAFDMSLHDFLWDNLPNHTYSVTHFAFETNSEKPTLTYIDNNNTAKSPNDMTLEELKHIKKYRTLDAHGKKLVEIVLNEEYERCTYVEAEELKETKPAIDVESNNTKPEKTYTGIAAAYGGDNRVNQVSEKHLREAADMIWEDEENED